MPRRERRHVLPRPHAALLATQAAGRASFKSDSPKTADLHHSLLTPFGVFTHLPAAVRRSRPPSSRTPLALAPALALPTDLVRASPYPNPNPSPNPNY